MTRSQSRSQKNMSNSLKTNILFIGLHLTVNEVCQRNLDMKSDLSLGDLKTTNEFKNSLKKLSNRIRIFYSELPYETRTGLFIAFSLLGRQN